MLSSTVMVRLAAMADTPRPTVRAATRIPLQKPFSKTLFHHQNSFILSNLRRGFPPVLTVNEAEGPFIARKQKNIIFWKGLTFSLIPI